MRGHSNIWRTEPDTELTKEKETEWAERKGRPGEGNLKEERESPCQVNVQSQGREEEARGRLP